MKARQNIAQQIQRVKKEKESCRTNSLQFVQRAIEFGIFQGGGEFFHTFNQ